MVNIYRQYQRQLTKNCPHISFYLKNMKLKKNVKAFFIILLVLAIPIVVLELSNSVIERKEAGTEIVNNIPIINEFPSTNAVRGQKYISSISAEDKDGDALKYSFVCDDIVNGCLKDEVKFPEGMMIDRTTGEIRWNVPSDAIDTVDIIVYVSDGKDVVYYDYSLWIESGDYYIREFSTLPSSAKITPGSEIRFRLVVEKIVEIDTITATFILDGVEVEILQWDNFDNSSVILIDYNSNPQFVFTPEIEGVFSVELEVKTKDGDVSLIDKLISVIFPKVLASDSLTFTAGENSVPVFDPTTNPDLNNVLKVGEMYSFDLKVSDPEDILYYSIVTPDPEHDWKDWLTVVPVVSSDGKQITFQLRGIPTKVGAYMVAISVNDGIKNHYVTKIWPIIVQDEGNDIPIVRITAPTAPVRVYSNGHVTFKWSVQDNNQVVKQIFYYSSNPSNKSTWKKIREFDHNVNEYSWQNGLSPGTYFVIIEAYDNMTPAGVGFSITEQIVVLPTPPKDPVVPVTPVDPNDPDDPNNNGGGGEIVISEPFISNIAPRDGATLKKLPITISASIGAGEGAEVTASAVNVLLNGDSIREKCKFNQRSSNELSLSCLVDDLKEGQHEVTVEVENTLSRKTSKKWYFKYLVTDVVPDDTTDDDGDTDDENIIDKIVVFWKELATNIRLLVCIGGVLILLGLLLLIPLLFSGRKKENYTYTYNNIDPDNPIAPQPQTLNQNTYENNVYEPSTFYGTDSSFGGPVVTAGTPISSTSQSGLVNEPVNNNDRLSQANVEPYSTDIDSQPVLQGVGDPVPPIQPVTEQSEPVTLQPVASDVSNSDLSTASNNPSSLVFSEEEPPQQSTLDDVGTTNFTSAPPVNSSSDQTNDGYVPPPTLSV